jgi:CheY-like chemotaxis protein
MVDASQVLFPANILVVDDHPDNLVAMEAVFKDSPEYHLVTASSGSEAIKRVTETEFALILLDIQMPEMDGYETAKRIKQLEHSKDVPIMLVTAIYKEDPHVLKGYSVGAIDYISKPFNPDVLKAKVSVYANLYIKSRQLMLQYSEPRNTSAILEALPVGIIVTDKTGKINQVNKEAARIWEGAKFVNIDGYEAYAGWRVDSGKVVRSHEWALARAIEKGETSHNEIVDIKAFNGAKKTILNSAIPLKGSRGEIVGAVAVMHDITGMRLAPTASMERMETAPTPAPNGS